MHWLLYILAMSESCKSMWNLLWDRGGVIVVIYSRVIFNYNWLIISHFRNVRFTEILGFCFLFFKLLF